jgi:hypothetical protein
MPPNQFSSSLAPVEVFGSERGGRGGGGGGGGGGCGI